MRYGGFCVEKMTLLKDNTELRAELAGCCWFGVPALMGGRRSRGARYPTLRGEAARGWGTRGTPAFAFSNGLFPGGAPEAPQARCPLR